MLFKRIKKWWYHFSLQDKQRGIGPPTGLRPPKPPPAPPYDKHVNENPNPFVKVLLGASDLSQSNDYSSKQKLPEIECSEDNPEDMIPEVWSEYLASCKRTNAAKDMYEYRKQLQEKEHEKVVEALAEIGEEDRDLELQWGMMLEGQKNG